MLLKNKRNHSIFISAIFLFILVASPVYSGTNCGSNKGIGKFYKDHSSDWWPDLRLYVETSLIATIPGYIAGFCSLAGGAYFGQACAWHDDCYDGKVGIGMNKKECDLELLNQWRHACDKKYGSRILIACKEYCETTAEGMYHALVKSPEAWNNAQPEREINITSTINSIYVEFFGRNATENELNLSIDYLRSTKSTEGLRQKVKKQFADTVSLISIIVPMSLE